MKNISTAAVVAFFYILISFSIDLFSGDITFSSASISHLLIGYVIVFVSYLIGVFIVHIFVKTINKKRVK
ncbi:MULTISPECIES: hypothetical protein [Lactobacillales]|jgi:TRAP-type C4-dicarboxylate transport system permease small subunit|uniref:Uncharacterized protein n=3 Tax=Enterococcus TaxID=1350 RepID=A0A377JZ63_9ENTE|nr:MULTISPECIES: hypothetical protein [Lactobacillales]EAF8786918.1 hypothetical protein [Listeria monocytogenes]EKA7731359.1 hypothetical protein [Listeria innocua]AKZ49561.1 hypothetical protein LIU_14565 [Enterococcus durans]EAH0052947.1 hypothetical protein [Listeria monocytogenes]EGO8076101.1 hypothetical protein [Enterococcus faecalis]